ncbi:MAG: hypothetical protein DI598_11260 [Pseudopedobacter saltans]|uniref:Uncharacterized protein n=1 Tax=Pseudopedobacter saltans TaxID=151895 RepID=A0A2W5GN42_9SPHI|nr:MAG: hypothetical protein DI598_11260 [Pseudopedobacter saltans]
MENLHIVFWLFKDIAWCLGIKWLGIVMVIPTLTIAVIIAWRTRHMMSERCHNLAITFWIMANSYWMISEFYVFDQKPLYGSFTYKDLALVPFFIGVITLGYYYLYWKPTHKSEL